MKKAQIKMFETIAVLVVVFFLIFFGLYFYQSSQMDAFKKSMTEDNYLKEIELIKVINYLPELQCSIDNVVTSNCIDVQKLRAFKAKTLDSKTYYTSILKSTKISVKEIYPSASLPDFAPEYEVFANVPASYSETNKEFIPILLYDPGAKRYIAGMMTVEVYASNAQ
jgi:hypothetical protein